MNRNSKNVLRLSQSRLRNLIKETVSEVLKEGLYGTNGNDANSWQKMANLRKERMDNNQDVRKKC